MTAPTEAGAGVAKIMRLVRRYGRMCTRDGARCAGLKKPGHDADVRGARMAVEKAVNDAARDAEALRHYAGQVVERQSPCAENKLWVFVPVDAVEKLKEFLATGAQP